MGRSDGRRRIAEIHEYRRRRGETAEASSASILWTMSNGGKLWRHRWLAGSAMPGAWLALGLVLAAAGCSEKPPAHALVWQLSRTLPIRRASLSGVVAASRDQAIAVGYDRPEGY